jgi:ABC-2 type transport system permease protein
MSDLLTLTRNEVLKLRTMRTPWILLGAALLVVLAGVSGRMADDADLDDPATAVSAIGHVGLVSLFALVLGVLAVAGEHRHRTATDTYLSTPQRSRVVITKLVVNLLAGAGLGLLCAMTAVAATALWYAALGGTLDLWSSDVWRTAGGGIAWCTAFAAIGVGVGALIRNLAGAITAALAWIALVEAVAGELLGDLGRWLPFRSGTALANMQPPGVEALTQSQAVLSLVVYTLLFTALGVSATVGRDVP